MTEQNQEVPSTPAGEEPAFQSPDSAVQTPATAGGEDQAPAAVESTAAAGGESQTAAAVDSTAAPATADRESEAAAPAAAAVETPAATIEIEGQKMPVDSLVFIVQHGINTCQVRSSITGDLNQANDQVLRAYQAAAFFSSNTAAAIGAQVLLCIASGDGALVKLAMQVGGRMNKRHEEFWKDYNACRDGDPPALPGDLETRRQGLRARLEAANALVDSTAACVEALADDDSLKASARLALQLVQVAQREAASSVEFALGNFNMEISDEQLKSTVDDIKLQLMVLMGKSEAEATAMIDTRLGATDAAKKAAMVNAHRTKLAADSQGSLDGALLSGEQELAVVELGVALLTIFMV